MPAKALSPPVDSDFAVPSLEAYGHSWFASAGASDYAVGGSSKFGMLERLAGMLGANLNRVAQSGGVIAAPALNGGPSLLAYGGVQPDKTGGPYVTRGGLKLCMMGYNDYTVYQGIANGALLVENGLTLAYSRLLASRIIPALTPSGALNTAEHTFGGSLVWAAGTDATIAVPSGFAYATQSGATTVTVTTAIDSLYNGEALTLILPLTGSNATVTVAADGTTVATKNLLTDFNVMAAASVASTMLCLRIPAGTLAAGAHSLVVTYSNINTYAIFGGWIIEATDPPPLIIPGFPLLEGNAAILAGAPWANTRNQNVMANFPSARFVDLNPAMSPNYPSAADLQYWSGSTPGHPNDYGYGRCAAELYRNIKQILTAGKGGQSTPPRIELNSWKDTVRAATTGNITLAGTQTVDGVALNAFDRVLVKNQTAPLQNGIYAVSAGNWIPVPDLNTNGFVTPGHAVNVSEGTTQGGTQWTLTTTAPIQWGVNALYYTRTSPSYGTLYNDPWDPSTLGDNMEREAVTASLTQVSGTVYLHGGYVLRAGKTYSAVNVFFTTAGSAVTHTWAGIVRQGAAGGAQYTLLAVSPDNTAAPGANAIRTFTFGTPYTPQVDTPIWVALCLVATTTVPSIGAGVVLVNSALAALTPVLVGTSNTGQTTPIVAGTVLTAPTATAQLGYAYLS